LNTDRIWFLTIDCFSYNALKFMPNLQTIAKESLFFPKSMTQSSYTLKALRMIFTGMEPYHFGMRTMDDMRRYDCMPLRMKQLGYKTYAYMMAPLVETYKVDFSSYFDEYHPPDEFHAAKTNAHGTPWVFFDDLKESLNPFFKDGIKTNDKFFLWTHLFDLHHPKLMRGYNRSFIHLDSILGFYLQNFDGIIVITGDHGEDKDKSHDKVLTDETIYTPFIISGTKHKGKQDKIMRHIDIYPTFCDALGLDIPKETEGKSALNIKKSRPGYCEFYLGPSIDLTCYTDHEFKLIWYEDKRNKEPHCKKLLKSGNEKNDVQKQYPEIMKQFNNEIMKRKNGRKEGIDLEFEFNLEQRLRNSLKK